MKYSIQGILTIENIHVCDNGCVLTIHWLPVFILGIILSTCAIYFIYSKWKCSSEVRGDHSMVRRDANGEMNILRPISIEYNICVYRSWNRVDVCVASIIEIKKDVDQVIRLTKNDNLICYCDGSYSHPERIGYAGFRASNGFKKTSFVCPNQPNNGSTITEVLALCLAIQYALKQPYQTLTIYTDNTKVEQLLKRPKQNDYLQYPDVCQILDEFYREKGQNSIEVIRIRGHPTMKEQRQSTVKAQFARIDRDVRKKTRRYIKRRRIHFKLNDYYYWYQPNTYSYYTYTIFGYYL